MFIRLPVILAMVAALAVSRAAARELPVRSFTTVDGLADNVANRIVPDSRGLLWICTNSGISRFDGSQFQSFGVAEGLPHPIINDLLEVPDGDFWLASNGGGVIRLRLPAAARRYEAFLVDPQPTANRVNRLFRTADGTIWLGTDGGLFRMTVRADGRPEFARVGLRGRHPDEMVQVWSLAADQEGTLWVGTRFGVARVLPDGRVVSYPVREDVETDHVHGLLYDPEHDALWIAHQGGLAILRPPPARSYGGSSDAGRDQPIEDRAIVRAVAGRRVLGSGPVSLPRATGEAVYFSAAWMGRGTAVLDVLHSTSGVIRVITGSAVFEFSAGRFTTLDDPRLQDGLGYGAEDREGNLWLTKRAAGIQRVARHGFITFRESDGVGQVGTILEDRAGELVALGQDWRLSRFDGERFQTVAVNIPALPRQAGWGANLRAIEDHRGEWWFATAAGLVRFATIRQIDDLATATPITYTTRDGLAQDSVNRLFEDSRGDIWISSLIPGRDVLTRWDRAANRFQKYSEADGLRAFNAPTGFFEDARHGLFITLRDGGIACYDGRRFRILTEADGLPGGNIGGGMMDRAGRLWCFGAAGVFRLDDLSAGRLRPVTAAAWKQFRGVTIGGLAEDAAGSLYVMTGKGIARFDDASIATAAGNPRLSALLTISDGLAGSEVGSVHVDRVGRLWFGTTRGLSYYEPEASRRVAAPQVRIGGVRIAGIEQPVSPAGDDSLAGLELTPGRSQLEIAFFGISFASGNTLSFDYRLIGASSDWSVPSPQASVMFSNLAPGNYAFEVRAVSAGGDRSPQPARATFRVLPPLWRRWWFMTLAALAAAAAVTWFERYRAATRREISRAREQRLVELEQVRRRIAADLHDEIGSSLTQISILSEVARQQGSQSLPELNHPLSMIAASSRELVDAMSDIVWAINPAKDHLTDLTQRMRRHAADAFTATGTTFRLDLPPADQEIVLGANLRREVFLIFKEAVNNVVKHSACTEATVAMTIEGSLLRLNVHDNGRGFDTRQPSDGHGLASLHARAAALGGTCDVVSAPGAGAAITISLPIPT